MGQVKHSLYRFAWILAFILAAGCAHVNIPQPHDRSEPLDPQDGFFIEKKVNDARYVNIRGFEHMKVGRPLFDRIEEYESLEGLEAKKSFVEEFLKEAYALNDRAVVDASQKLTVEEISAFLAVPHSSEEEDEDEEFDPNVPGDTPRERFLNAYRKHAEEEFRRELSAFRSISSEEIVDRYWKKLVSSIDESIITKGRTTRMVSMAPLVPFVYAWIWYHELTDDRGPHVPEFSDRTVFYPEERTSQEDVSRITDDWLLLRYYAPVVAQEKAKKLTYAPEVDRFGEVYLNGTTLEEAIPSVSTEKPALYAYVARKRIQGAITRQLVYTLWYPEHPKLHRSDPEAGIMEGWTLRITLNRENRPLIYESVSNCGCYYKIFPTRALEDMSKWEFAEKIDGKSFYLENRVPGKTDAVVPELVSLDDDPTQRVALYYSAGKHQLVTIRSEKRMDDKDRTAPRETYRLLSYDRLENLPFNGRLASLFDENGLVRKAHRTESTLLAPSGMYHAGHPRQRLTQLIYFDQAEFDDPKLFETYLRLPSRAFTR